MGYNNYRNGYKNHNRNNDRDRKVYSDDDKDNKKVDLSKLDINSILDSDTENLVFDNYDDDRFSKKPYKNKDNKNNFNKEWDNPLCKFLDKDSVYDRDDIYNVLTKKNGLSKMIDDLNINATLIYHSYDNTYYRDRDHYPNNYLNPHILLLTRQFSQEKDKFFQMIGDVSV